MDSYDRLFPSQVTMPRGGFGNLIALPLHVERAILHEDSFAIDFVWQGGTYSAILRRDEDGWFRGRWSRRSPFPAEGKAACLFRDGDGHVKLLGSLTEERREWLWVGMLEPVSEET